MAWCTRGFPTKQDVVQGLWGWGMPAGQDCECWRGLPDDNQATVRQAHCKIEGLQSTSDTAPESCKAPPPARCKDLLKRIPSRRQSKSPAVNFILPASLSHGAGSHLLVMALQMSAFALYRQQPVAEPCRQQHAAGKALWS